MHDARLVTLAVTIPAKRELAKEFIVAKMETAQPHIATASATTPAAIPFLFLVLVVVEVVEVPLALAAVLLDHLLLALAVGVLLFLRLHKTHLGAPVVCPPRQRLG